MIRIEFVEPSEDPLWQGWRRDCQAETERLVHAVEQDGTAVEIIDLYKRDSIKKKYYHAGKRGGVAPFHGKCAFCEDKREILHVEHFRPKKRVHEEAGHPGYYWLAYDHRNLLLSCEDCNTGRKQDQFPLDVSGVRAWCSTDDLALESPLLLNPLDDDPRTHLRIDLDEGMLFAKTQRGKTCIDVLGLNRDNLREGRKAVIDQIQKKWLEAKQPETRAGAIEFMRECVMGHRRFTLTARAVINQLRTKNLRRAGLDSGRAPA